MSDSERPELKGKEGARAGLAARAVFRVSRRDDDSKQWLDSKLHVSDGCDHGLGAQKQQMKLSSSFHRLCFGFFSPRE